LYQQSTSPTCDIDSRGQIRKAQKEKRAIISFLYSFFFIRYSAAVPELPEVETVRRSLARHIIGAKIIQCEVLHPKYARQSPGLAAWLTGRTIKAIDRRAKLLIVRFTKTDEVLTVHLKMTGQFILQAPNVRAGGGHSDSNGPQHLPNSHTRVILNLSGRAVLYFNDQRLFGYFKTVSADDLEHILTAYGIEPGTPAFTYEAFAHLLRKRQAPLKAVLLDQTRIAGLGNIYVDEACFRARVRPTRKAATLTQVEGKLLWQACDQVITEATEMGGTTFRNYQDIDGRMGGFIEKLRVYSRAGKPCVRCKKPHLIKKIVCAGRGTHYCSNCQR
jgi:formamidopyrimidine-DNA glycosylase